MSDKNIKDGPLPVEDTTMALPPDDMIFLVECLKNPVGGGIISIDTKAVAEKRGYKNAGSVANRIAKLKKRFNLPIVASLSGSRKVDSSLAGENTVPMVPTKNKVTKPRNNRGRAKKVVKKANSSNEESSGDDKECFKESGEESETKGMKHDNPKVSDVEEGEILDDAAEDGEEGGQEEKPEVLKVEEGYLDEDEV